MSEENQKSGCAKVAGVLFFLFVMMLAVAAGGVMWTWDSWGSKQWAKLRGDEVIEKEEREAIIMALGARPVVATKTIQADPAVYQRWVQRDDVLVMVEYYTDT